MRNLILVCCCLTLAPGALAGCNKTADQSAGEAVGQVPGSPTGAAAAGGQTGQSETGGQGSSASAAAGGGTQLPEGWPASLPVYPNSEIVAAYSTGSGADQAFAVNLNTSATPEMVMAFYKEKALAAGFTQVNAVNDPERSFAHFTGEAWNFNVTCTASNGTTGVMLALGATGAEGGAKSGEGHSGWEDGEGGESTESNSGGQPESDIADILKQYPGGQIDNTVTRGAEHLMTQRTTDTADAVVKFYTDYFTGRGWVLEASIDSDAGMMRSFTGAAGQLTLNANPRDGGAFITLNYKEQ